MCIRIHGDKKNHPDFPRWQIYEFIFPD